LIVKITAIRHKSQEPDQPPGYCSQRVHITPGQSVVGTSLPFGPATSPWYMRRARSYLDDHVYSQTLMAVLLLSEVNMAVTAAEQ